MMSSPPSATTVSSCTALAAHPHLVVHRGRAGEHGVKGFACKHVQPSEWSRRGVPRSSGVPANIPGKVLPSTTRQKHSFSIGSSAAARSTTLRTGVPLVPDD